MLDYQQLLTKINRIGLRYAFKYFKKIKIHPSEFWSQLSSDWQRTSHKLHNFDQYESPKNKIDQILQTSMDHTELLVFSNICLLSYQITKTSAAQTVSKIDIFFLKITLLFIILNNSILSNQYWINKTLF